MPDAAEWPDAERPRVFEHLARSYDELIGSAAITGAVKLFDVRGLPHLSGQALRGGAFAVPRDSSEDRWISPLEETNALVDPDRVPSVAYPYLPQLGSLLILPHQRPVVSKRDARNYYPTLAAGDRWWRWFPSPSLSSSAQDVPCHTTWPMGFRGSCVIAQGVTDVVTEVSQLPQDRRCLPGISCPMTLPVWGSILDDVWVIYDEADPGPLDPHMWCKRVDSEWSRVGVQTHPKKQIDGGLNEEVQGGRVDCEAGSLGLSPMKTLDLIRAGLWALTCWRPARAMVDRVVGKVGHAHGFRPCMRCSFGEMFRFLEGARASRQSRVFLSDLVFEELLEALLLLPLATLDLRAPFCERVVCTDASSYAHGLAYAKVPAEMVQRWSRACVHRGDAAYGHEGVEFVHQDPICPMGKVDFPLHEQ